MSRLPADHDAEHFSAANSSPMAPANRDLIRVGGRRWFLQTGLATVAGLSMADVLRLQAQASGGTKGGTGGGDRKAVILIWLSGGPSHIDTWDPKPTAPQEIRGPYRAISTSVPGIQVCEHLPLQAKIMDKLTIVRSVDCKASNHTPITMQAGNELARRTDDHKDGQGYPSMGAIAAKFRGPNVPSMPPFVGLAGNFSGQVYGAGNLGRQYAPVSGRELLGKLAISREMTVQRLQDRRDLRQQFDGLSQQLDKAGEAGALDVYHEMAFDMLTSGKVRQAFDVSKESAQTRAAYGRTSLGDKAMLARRLVEAGVTFVVLSGEANFDHHGDEIKAGGILKGLTPLLPDVDRVMHALVTDLESRGLLDSTLVLMLGEFGRTPVMTKTNGRGHWLNVMSMVAAGGGFAHGKVIGSTDDKGYGITDAPVRPADLAATTFRHLGIDVDAHWIDPKGRPISIVTQNGRPIPGLS